MPHPFPQRPHDLGHRCHIEQPRQLPIRGCCDQRENPGFRLPGTVGRPALSPVGPVGAGDQSGGRPIPNYLKGVLSACLRVAWTGIKGAAQSGPVLGRCRMEKRFVPVDLGWAVWDNQQGAVVVHELTEADAIRYADRMNKVQPVLRRRPAQSSQHEV